MADADPNSPDSSGDPVPRVLCDVEALARREEVPAGAMWRLAEPERQLDANLVHVPPEESIDTHVEPGLDVLLHVVGGTGTLVAASAEQPLAEGSLVWLPRGSRRSLAAGKNGLSYLTVHSRRPGMQIHRAGR